jgi:hypothetical protein
MARHKARIAIWTTAAIASALVLAPVVGQLGQHRRGAVGEQPDEGVGQLHPAVG